MIMKYHLWKTVYFFSSVPSMHDRSTLILSLATVVRKQEHSLVQCWGTCVKDNYLFIYFFYYLFFYKLFWTQACPEGIGTNGTQRSHARCHPYPIPQPVKVGHTTGVYVPYSFRTVVWVLLRPTRTDQWKCCEMGPTVFRPYPRRLESRTICRCHYKGITFFSVI